MPTNYDTAPTDRRGPRPLPLCLSGFCGCTVTDQMEPERPWAHCWAQTFRDQRLPPRLLRCSLEGKPDNVSPPHRDEAPACHVGEREAGHSPSIRPSEPRCQTCE